MGRVVGRKSSRIGVRVCTEELFRRKLSQSGAPDERAGHRRRPAGPPAKASTLLDDGIEESLRFKVPTRVHTDFPKGFTPNSADTSRHTQAFLTPSGKDSLWIRLARCRVSNFQRIHRSNFEVCRFFFFFFIGSKCQESAMIDTPCAADPMLPLSGKRNLRQ